MMRRPLVLIAWLTCLLVPPLRAETVRLTPLGLGPVTVSWLSHAGEAVAPEHELAPRLALEGGALILETTLTDGSVMKQRALGVRGQRALPGTDSLIEVVGSDASPETPRLTATVPTGPGLHELFTLAPSAVKHDLVVGREALAALGSGDVVAEWALQLPPGARVVREDLGPATSGLRIETESSAFLARLPAPTVRDADDEHDQRGPARFELAGTPAAPVLRLVVDAAWAHDPARALPLLIDPTVSLQPADRIKTGFVDEFGNLDLDQIDSGSLTDVRYGAQVRGFAEFPLGSIPDTSVILSARLQVWLSNHDNPLDPAVPLPMEVKFCPAPASTPPLPLHAAIPPMGAGRIYVTENVPRTGSAFCPDSYAFRDYDLGPLALADIQAQLAADYFTVGFTSGIVTDPGFDHIDYIGFLEQVNNPFTCAFTDFPGTRITLVLEYAPANLPPVCNAGGPYASDCPATPLPISAALSSDPDGDPLTYAWTSDCSGFIENPGQVDAVLHLDASCGEDCTVTVTVSDGRLSSSCTASVSAHDVTPPVVSGTDLAGLCLWPPRHDMFCLGSPAGHVTASDACQPAVTLRWAGCVSDQPDEAREPGRPENGDGHFSDDCQVSADGQELCVRVERAGSDPVDGRNTFDGRHYGVAVLADDGCGNVVVVDAGTIWVPHDRRGGSGGQDDPCLSGSKVK